MFFGAELLGDEVLPGGQDFGAGAGGEEAVEDGAAGALDRCSVFGAGRRRFSVLGYGRGFAWFRWQVVSGGSTVLCERAQRRGHPEGRAG
jgi:hypothetical protein